MKKVLMAIAMVLLLCATAHAYPFYAGDQVYLEDGYIDVNDILGNFTIYNANDTTIEEQTFCVQHGTDVEFNTEYIIVTVDDTVQGFAPGDTGSTALEWGTRFLFGAFASGELTGYTNTEQNAIDLQKAIWAFQGYTIDITGNEFYSAGLVGEDYYEVAVLNLWDYNKNPIQSQLTWDRPPDTPPPPPVPEPATCLLLGSGLLGIWFSKKRIKL